MELMACYLKHNNSHSIGASHHLFNTSRRVVSENDNEVDEPITGAMFLADNRVSLVLQ